MKSFLFLLLIFSGYVSNGQNADIREYGSVGDGKTINTKFIQAAIDSVSSRGGGKLVIPPGIFVTGTLHLRSNVHLYLSPASVIRGSSNLDDYESFIPSKPYTPIHKGMFFTEDAENISITGEGQIDGNGNVFFDQQKAKKLDTSTTRFTRQGAGFRHVETGIGDGPIVPHDRPYQMFVFSNCRRITIKDIFITESPFWCMHIADCDAVNISGIRLWNNLLAPNADGIDITSSSNVIIRGCDIRAGDDAIVVAGYNHHYEIPGYRYLRHTMENIIVSDCNLQSYSSGIRIGYLDQNSVNNVQVNNCNITNSTRGIGIFLRDEGSLSNINFSNIYIETKLRTGDWWGNGEPIHISAIRGNEKVKLGKIQHIKFNHISCKSENGILVYGTPESIIEDLVLNDLSIDLVDSKLNDVAGGNVDLRGCIGDSNGLFKRNLPAILVQYADHVRLENIILKWVNPTQSFFTHGIELDHFNEVCISNFKGGASPVNKMAFRIYAANGKDLHLDNNSGVKRVNIH